MGNWTTVNIVGTCPANEVSKLSEYVNRYNSSDDWDNFHCLSATNGLCGLGDWPATEIDAAGNLAERDYSTGSVAEQLEIIGNLCPNADIKVHVGGDYETLDVINTVHLKAGIVEIKEPEIPTLKELDQETIKRRLMKIARR